MEKLPNKKYSSLEPYVSAFFSIAVIVSLSSKLPILSLDRNSQLAQIIAIETVLLRK